MVKIVLVSYTIINPYTHYYIVNLFLFVFLNYSRYWVNNEVVGFENNFVQKSVPSTYIVVNILFYDWVFNIFILCMYSHE